MKETEVDVEKAIIVRFGGRREIIVHHNVDTDEYFFSMDHCQMVEGKFPYTKTSYHDSTAWVPCTTGLPTWVVPRPGLEDGWVDTVAKYIFIFHPDNKRVPNPDPYYDPLKLTAQQKTNWRPVN